MGDTDNQVQRIEDKVQQLLKEYNGARKEIQRLQKENSRLNEQLKMCNDRVVELSQKADILKIKANGLPGDSKKELEKRIDSYLKDIDKCLALLHS